MKFPRNFVRFAAFTILLLPAASSADDLQYPRHPVVASAPEMSTHLGQFGLPALRPHPHQTPVATRLDQLQNQPAQDLIATANRPTALEGLPKPPNAAKMANRPEPGVFASVDYLSWTLRRRDLDYAITSQPGALVFSNGEIHELDHPREPGVRAVMGYEFSNGWQIGVGYINFDSTSSGTAEDGAGTLFATRSHPDINRRAGIAAADSSFDMRVLDLEVRNSLELSERATITLFGSFRWADFDQSFHVFYDEIEFPIGGDVTSFLQTKAFGIRIGADGKWSLTPHLYLVGTAETSILYGENSFSLTETEGTTTILSLTDSYQQALPVLGTRVGGGYTRGQLSVEAGYEMQVWFDLGDRMSFLDDQHLGVFAHSNHNVMMDGFYLRLGWKR